MRLRFVSRSHRLTSCSIWIILAIAAVAAVRDTKYYDILGVSPDADERTIKRAYKKQALKWHPDRNQDNKRKAEDKFRDIAHAYEILTDPEKKKMYDQYGEEALKQGGGGGPGGPGGFRFQGDPFEMFNAFFGGGGGMGGFQGGGRQNIQFNMGGLGGGFQGGFMGGGFPGGQRRQQPGGGGGGGLYDQDSNVMQLNSADFPETSHDWVWLVEFYSPGCGHCQALAPKWKLLAEKLKGVVKVAAVNCAQEPVCQKFGIQGVPSIKALAPGDKSWTDYNGPRTANDISAWATSLIPNKVTLVRTAAEVKVMLKSCQGGGKSGSKAASWNLCVILITDKAGTPSLWKALSAVYSSKIAFGLVRAKDGQVLAELDHSGEMPTVISVCNGDLETREVFKGKLKSEPLQHHLRSYAAGKKCNSQLKVDASTDFSKFSVGQLKELLRTKGIACSGCLEKGDYVLALRDGLFSAHKEEL